MAAPGKDSNVDDEQQQAAPPRRLVFRVPRPSLLAVGAVMLFAFPFATGLPWLWLVYLLPLAAGYWVLRLRTVADRTGIVARNLLRTDRMTWDEVRSLRLSERHWMRAVRTDGREVQLPAVRLRHLPALSLVSSGRITDPTEPQGTAAAAESQDSGAADAPPAESPATETAATKTRATETPATETPATETPASETPATKSPARDD